jgi:hypothetical protein
MSEERGDRIVNGPHQFWLATCGIDTHARSSQHARNDTPWAAFTADGKRLVCTVWADLVAPIHDPLTGAVRRFVVLGGRSNEWKGGAVKRGRETREHLERARAERLPVFGFMVSAAQEESFEVSRSIKHVHLDQVHVLKQLFGMEVDALKERLGIMTALAARWKSSDADALGNGMLFELVDAVGELPGADWSAHDADADVPVGVQEHWARVALPMLVEHVQKQTDGELARLTYKELAERIGWFNKNGDPHWRLGGVLGRVTVLIETATAGWPEEHKPPYLTTVVVVSGKGENAGLPDVGIKHRWPQFHLLSLEEKRARVLREYEAILAYGERWQAVLEAAGLARVKEVDPPEGGAPAPGGWGGGESDEHRALKEFVLVHPELFGAPQGCFAKTEYDLLSADCIDVFFRTDVAWVGVEVKSRKSDDMDLERGVYQVVKYRAVLTAQALIHADGQPAIEVYLATERALPPRLQKVADVLGVQCKVVDHLLDGSA